ncbi:MAG: TetR/AcrR family transcriptional regulator, partial [bacterium]
MKREERQKTILDTTMRLIAEYGFFDFSMKDVAERVQISGVVVYRDFESRENLMIEAYKSVREEFIHFSEALMVPAESNQSIKTGILKYIGYSYMKFLVRL